MLISETKKFGFVHFHKTGGTWLASVLNSAAPKEWELKQQGHPHARADSAPAGFRLFAFVRNPWDWYVSNYFFYRQHWEDHTGGYLMPREKWLKPEEDFAKMFEATSGCEDGFAQHIPKVIEGEYNHTQMTAAFTRIVRTYRHEMCIGKFENLHNDAVQLLEWVTETKIPDVLFATIYNSKRLNSSRHMMYRKYYTKQLQDLVYEKDKDLINEFGYRF